MPELHPVTVGRNPVERIMSILNLELQCVGLIMKEGSEIFEREASKCNSLKDLRKTPDRCPDFKGEALTSVEPVKLLLTQVFERLQLKEKNIKCFSPAAEDIVDLWNNLQLIESDCGDPGSLCQKENHSRSLWPTVAVRDTTSLKYESVVTRVAKSVNDHDYQLKFSSK